MEPIKLTGSQIVDIKDFPGYKISSNGEVYSLWISQGNKGGQKIGNKMKLLKPYKTKGYYLIVLQGNHKRYAVGIHRLVAQTFIPNPNNYPFVCHNDGNPLNNQLNNLRWDTPKGNMVDKVKHGTAVIKEKHPRSKLNSKKVKLIKLLYHFFKWRKIDLAKLFGVTDGTINQAIKGKTWKI